MPKNFDKLVEKIQNEIMQKEIEDHNEKIVSLYYNPQNWGKPPFEEITVYEELRGGPKQYFLGIYLKIENGIISKANFLTDGCGVMVATCSQMTILIKGKSIEFADDLKKKDINNGLMGIPPDEQHCIDLTIHTLRSAIKKYKLNK
jgi:nitrogen fixation NifU-like protein